VAPTAWHITAHGEEPVMRRLNLGNAYYLSSPHPMSRNIKIKIYKTIILPVLCMGGKQPLALREERRLKVFENRVVRSISGHNSDEVTGSWRQFHNEELHNLYSSQNIIRTIKSRRMRRAWRKSRMHIRFWWETLKEKDH
jgi:hypothetical protein